MDGVGSDLTWQGPPRQGSFSKTEAKEEEACENYVI